MRKTWLIVGLIMGHLIFVLPYCHSQQELIKKDQYQLGPDEKLLIRVHIFGEVKKTGEYLVPDDTDLLELISKAGGPTEFSNLRSVKLTRGLPGIASSGKASKKLKKEVIEINLKKLLNDEKFYSTIPKLQPGDVVQVGRNAWFTWQTIIRVVSQLAIVAQVWYWYSRAE